MRRWIALFLLCWLPLQSLWAAAAPYCQHAGQHAGQMEGQIQGQHEQPRQTTHLGHHQHEHSGLSDADVPSSDGQTPNVDHADCHACHGHCAAVPQATDLTALGKPHEGLMPTDDAKVPAAPVALPDRPNWSSLA
jgi:hypothetical protein